MADFAVRLLQGSAEHSSLPGGERDQAFTVYTVSASPADEAAFLLHSREQGFFWAPISCCRLATDAG